MLRPHQNFSVCLACLLRRQHHYNKFYINITDAHCNIFINLHTLLTPFTRSHRTLRDHLTGSMHSWILFLLYTLANSHTTVYSIESSADLDSSLIRKFMFNLFPSGNLKAILIPFITSTSYFFPNSALRYSTLYITMYSIVRCL